MSTHLSLSLSLSLTAVGCSHITQYQELTLLREFEKKEKTFTLRYQTKRKESRDMETKVGVLLSVCQSPVNSCIGAFSQIHGLGAKLKQLEKKVAQLQEQEKTLMSQFMERVGEGNKFKDFLLKVQVYLLPSHQLMGVAPGVPQEDQESESQRRGEERGRGRRRGRQ